MGKIRHIDHRRPSRSAGQPQVLRGGVKIPAHPEPISPEEQKRQEAMLLLQRDADEAERKLAVRDAEVQQLKQQLIDARDALGQIQIQTQHEPETPMPTSIEIVTVDDIARDTNIATVQVLAAVDGAVGELELMIPIDQLKQIIQQKRNQHAEDTNTKS